MWGSSEPKWYVHEDPEVYVLTEKDKILAQDGDFFAIRIAARSTTSNGYPDYHPVRFYIAQEIDGTKYVIETVEPGNYWQKKRTELIEKCHQRAHRQQKLNSLKEQPEYFYRQIWKLAFDYLEQEMIKGKEPNSVITDYLIPDKQPGEASLNEIFKLLLAICVMKSSYYSSRHNQPIDARCYEFLHDEEQESQETWQRIREITFNFDPNKTVLVKDTQENQGGSFNSRRSKGVSLLQTASEAAEFFALFDDGKDFDSWVKFLKSKSPYHPLMILRSSFSSIYETEAQEFLSLLGYQEYRQRYEHVYKTFRGLELVTFLDEDDVIDQVITDFAEILEVTTYAVERIFWLIGSGNFYKHRRVKTKLTHHPPVPYTSKFVRYVKDNLGY